jgi:hypothetical protein
MGVKKKKKNFPPLYLRKTDKNNINFYISGTIPRVLPLSTLACPPSASYIK